MAVHFVAYIDESGDTGLAAVKPNDPGGATEWLVLSCFLVRAENDAKLVSWRSEIQGQFKNVRPDLHFSKLLPHKKKIACEALAGKPCRCFVVMSNKKNIEKYKNPKLDAGNKAWIYWWLARLLLERVTEYCEEQVPADQRNQQKLRIVFSRRGILRYKDFNDYLWKLYWQSGTGTLFIGFRDIKWSVVDFDEIFVLDHKTRAGLQFADIVAGAFFQAVERNRPGECDPTYAKILKPVMNRGPYGNYLGRGLKTMPRPGDMVLAVQQREIFEYYGYSKLGW